MVTVEGTPPVDAVQVRARLSLPGSEDVVRETTVNVSSGAAQPFEFAWVLERRGRHFITVSVTEVAGEARSRDNYIPAEDLRFEVVGDRL